MWAQKIALSFAVCFVVGFATANQHSQDSIEALLRTKAVDSSVPQDGIYKPERVIVVGDLHGDLQQTLVALQLSEVIDRAGKWIGGETNTRLVQMGDLVDRGHQDKEVLDFMIRLKREAEADAIMRPHYYRLRSGSDVLQDATLVSTATLSEFAVETGLSYVDDEEGQMAALDVWVNRQLTLNDAPVTVLLGNHEVMNLDDDMRYAAPESNVPFFVEEEERRLREVTDDEEAAEAAIAQMHASIENGGGGLPGAKSYYASAGIEGRGLQRDALEARRRMFRAKGAQPGQAGGKYGTFLQFEAKLIHIYNDSVFVHAGLKPQFARYGLEKLNAAARSAITAKATLQDGVDADKMSLFQSPIFASDGPVWTRDLVSQAQSRRCTQVVSSLNEVDVNRMFVGHTPQRDLQIGSYCEGKFIVTDVGISRWMYGGLSTVEMISHHQHNDQLPSTAEASDRVEVRVVDPSDLKDRADRELDLLEEKGGVDQFVLEELMQTLGEAEKAKRRSGRVGKKGGPKVGAHDEL